MSNVLKRATATTVMAASAFGVMAATAPQALAVGNNDGNASVQAGNVTPQAVGNTTSNGYMSPNMALVQGGVLNCFDLQKVDAQVPLAALIGVNVPVQDVLTDQTSQVCSPGAVQQNGDDPLANVLQNVLSANG
ncbi:RdlA protein [Yinghuangia sp. ASG 101]|uniref:rodlin n=1 Tax=Yinghuangia sp. ASG 101 TaxID=2896848 RepID=UPI001E575472|nr:rodlin [Yinghuangia sp. ASG 101]UGQ13151.1 RdlA protein [Yinghuangia sp. ASG 101]